jgi:hypothetical protein
MKKMMIVFAVLTGFSVTAQDSIRVTDLKSAAKLIDLNYTQKELDTMYAGVMENFENYRLMHKEHLDNSVPMSLWQNPVLPGMQFNLKQQPIDWNIPSNINLPKNKNDLAYYSVLELASLIKNKKISSVALTQFFIDRLKRI